MFSATWVTLYIFLLLCFSTFSKSFNFLNLKDFDFHLPDSLIAQKPLPDRDQSKLMILDRNSGSIKHEIFKNLPHYIAPQSLMVFNNTKVVPSKLNGYIIDSLRPIEVLLVKETSKKNHWEALIKGLNKIKTGTEFEFGNGKLGKWISYTFNQGQWIHAIRVKGYSGASNSIPSWHIEYSMDNGSSWTKAWTATNMGALWKEDSF